MKVMTLVFNVVLLAFTCLVLATDGLPKEAKYVVFASWMMLTPILSIVVISLKEMNKDSRIGTIICNGILIGFVCWALVDQYPHPEESGFIEYVVLMVLTPIISIAALARKRKPGDSVQAHTA